MPSAAGLLRLMLRNRKTRPPAATTRSRRAMYVMTPSLSVQEDFAEHVDRQVDAHLLELLVRLRARARGPELAYDLAALIPCLLEAKDILKDDGVAFHPLNLGDVGDLPRAVLQTLLV